MKKKWIWTSVIILLFICMIVFFLLLRSGPSKGEEKTLQDVGSATMDTDRFQAGMDMSMENASSQEPAPEAPKIIEVNNPRMIIYQASIHMEVKELPRVLKEIEKMTTTMGGYIVESNTSSVDEHNLEGSVTLRIPEENFALFLEKTEGLDADIKSKDVSGNDVTEEYVDLESRLKSKRVTEERLLSFMEKSQTTEELLKVSNDLARVQEEIETTLGRMKYLENRSSLSTITIYMSENKIVIPEIEKGELNTWNKTKQAFRENINGLLAFSSGLFVFFVGNSPTLVALALVIGVVGVIFRKKIKKWFRNDNKV